MFIIFPGAINGSFGNNDIEKIKHTWSVKSDEIKIRIDPDTVMEIENDGVFIMLFINKISDISEKVYVYAIEKEIYITPLKAAISMQIQDGSKATYPIDQSVSLPKEKYALVDKDSSFEVSGSCGIYFDKKGTLKFEDVTYMYVFVRTNIPAIGKYFNW